MTSPVLQGSEKSVRYDFIDAIRGIAALLVMLQHGLERSGLEGLGHDQFAMRWLNFGQAGVAAFFIVSGFVIPLSLEKWNDIGRFWLSRVCRIYPLYLFTYFIVVVLVALSGWDGSFPNLHDIFINLIAHVLLMQQSMHVHNFVPQSWTLSIEFIWYAIFSILFLTSKNKKSAIISIFTLLIASALSIASLASPYRIPMGRVGLLVLCVLGLLFYRREKKEIKTRMFRTAVFIMLYTAGLCLAVGLYLRPSANSIALTFNGAAHSWLLGFAFFTVAFCTRSSRIWSLRWFKYLGLISYSLYLLHEPIMLIMDKFGITGFPYLALLFPATILGAGLTYRYIERPAILWAHNRMRKSEA